MLTEKQLLTSITALRRFAVKLTQQDGEDLLQDTLCRGWAKRHLFIEGDPIAWLMTIMHNQHINAVRKSARDSQKIFEVPQTVPEAQSAHRFAVEVKRSIEQLPEGQQQVLVFAAINGEQYADAAIEFGIPVGTVRSRLWRGRESLRRRFA